MDERRFVVEREFEHCGLKCVVVLQDLGHRCGYVGVGKNHPLYGVFYDNEEVYNLYVHGGITYASDGEGQYPVESEGVWWFGFDCAHWEDRCDHKASLKHFPHLREMIMIRMEVDQRHKFGTVRTIKYVKEQCKILAEQLYLLEQKALCSGDRKEDSQNPSVTP